jgi:hypothetical protein
MLTASPGSYATMTFKTFAKSLVTGAVLAAAVVALSGCIVLGAAGAVGGAAVAVTGTAVGLAAKGVSATAHGVGDVAGAIIPGGKKDDKGS